MDQTNKAVVTVVGNDAIGIIARVSAVLAHHEANILDISQTVLSGVLIDDDCGRVSEPV